jgi:hypothetical protein
MRKLATALLLHTTGSGSHYDWLVEDPTVEAGAERSLWAARVARGSGEWARLGHFGLTPLPLHRRRYLTYQGEISGGRGWVRRVDEGSVLPLMWAQGRRILAVRMQGFCGRVEMRADGLRHWRAWCI